MNLLKKIANYLFSGVLTNVNWKENWKFALAIVAVLFLIVYLNISYTNKLKQIDQLNREIIFQRDRAMDLKELNFNIVMDAEQTLENEATLQLFNTGSYLPYIIPLEKDEITIEQK